MKENIVYIVNPISGKLSRKNKKSVIENIDPSTKPEIIFSKSAEDAGKKAQEFMLKKYLVVACGGDGFINTIAQKAIDYACNMALLPVSYTHLRAHETPEHRGMGGWGV